MNVLVVNDAGTVQRLVAGHLEEFGHPVHYACDVDAAEVLLETHRDIDLIISDIYMPGRSGIELLQLAKRMRQDIEVVLMTEHTGASSGVPAVERNAFAYLQKPFGREELLKVVERAARHIEMCREQKLREHEVQALAKQLGASEFRYKTLLEGVGGVVLTTDPNLIINSASEGCAEMLGRASEELIGKSIGELRPADGIADFRGRAEELLRQGSGIVRFEGRLLRSDGAVLHSLEVVAPLSDNAVDGQPTGILWIIQDVTAEHRLRAEVERARDYMDAVWRARSGAQKIVGESLAIRGALRMIKSVANAGASVLICGESGTGKGLVAESLHISSWRAAKPFVTVNCARLEEPLLEDELFGHQRGAFAGAVSDKRGLVEIASEGTLFVDEVDKMTPAVQGKLLCALEHGRFRRLGDAQDRTVHFRIVAATNRDLSKEIKAGRFREDLLYRLGVIRIELSPLRERREDIPLIAEHLLCHSDVSVGKPKRLAPAALDALLAYDWPGNVRELSNVLERAVILSGEDENIGLEYLSLPSTGMVTTVRKLRDLEDDETRKALAITKGNKTQAAKMLGITRQTLISRLKRLAGTKS